MPKRALSLVLSLTLALLMCACESLRPMPTPTPSATPTHTPSATATPTFTTTPTATFTATATPTPTHTATPTITPTATPTPDPYKGLTIADLINRTYGEGEFRIAENMVGAAKFARYLFVHPSDGLNMYGFMDVPYGNGPFPVVIMLHGYIPPAEYTTLHYTTRYADELASNGYLVIHPNLRGYAPSDSGPNSFRVGMAIDVLNLIALIKKQGGKPGPLQKADPNNIGIWGHSMGGGISIRVITVNSDVKAAVLYGSMNADERVNLERMSYWARTRGTPTRVPEIDTLDADLRRISPVYYLDRITAAVSIHHSEADPTVPVEWSVDLCKRLQDLKKSVECFTYKGEPHTMIGPGDVLFRQRVIQFYDKHLKGKQ